MCSFLCIFFFFFKNTATTEIYTLSLHDALPIFRAFVGFQPPLYELSSGEGNGEPQDRKSTRLNSSHLRISYAVFCLKRTTQPYSDAAQIGSPPPTTYITAGATATLSPTRRARVIYPVDGRTNPVTTGSNYLKNKPPKEIYPPNEPAAFDG